MDRIVDLVAGILAGLAGLVLQVFAAVLVDTTRRAIDNPTVTGAVTVALAAALFGQAMRLRRLGLLAGITVALPLAVLAITWKENGRLRRSVWLGCIVGFPVACALVAGNRTGNARWNALVLIVGWTIAVFAPGDIIWTGQPGGLLWQRIGNGTLRQWWRQETARETIESSLRRTIDPRVQVSRVRPAGEGRWDARVLVPEKLSPDIVEDKAGDHTIGSTVTRVAIEKGFAERVQDVVVRPDRAEGQGVQLISVMTGDHDPLAGTTQWTIPSTMQATLDPINVGRYATGEPVLIGVPGVGGGHVLLGGESGSGKTTVEDAFIGQLAMRDNVAILASDPKWVGMTKWEPRLTTLALDDQTATPLLLAASDLMAQRKIRLAAERREDWDLRLGPWIVVVFDEAGVLGLGDSGVNATAMFELLSQGRALGIGVLLAMHRPSTGKLKGDLRDLFPIRIGLAMGSQDGCQMIFGEGAPPAHKISEHEKGVGYVRIARQTHRFRSHLCPVDPREIAEATAHLRVDTVGEFAGWPHRKTNPPRHNDQTPWQAFDAPPPKSQRRGRVVIDDDTARSNA